MKHLKYPATGLLRLELTVQGLGRGERGYIGASNEANPTDTRGLERLVDSSMQVAGSSSARDGFLLGISALKKFSYHRRGCRQECD